MALVLMASALSVGTTPFAPPYSITTLGVLPDRISVTGATVIPTGGAIPP
ncbi:hypothetical protein [Aliiruegeria lutimaris]|nr:hypothetical protein [Aliiruegeria lutimaris]